MKFRKKLLNAAIAFTLSTSLGLVAHAHDNHKKKQAGEIYAKSQNTKMADFDIVHASIKADKHWLTFHMHVSGKAGKTIPTRTGKFEGSDVFSYVWPTKLDSSAVGFDSNQGILAMAITSHPDFDDTPLFDENGDGDLSNDGAVWHSHWVVLVPDDACGPGALKVKDIAENTNPKMPATWPGVPIYLDSPGYSPVIKDKKVEVRVPMQNTQSLKGVAFDGVTSGLRVNESAHAPLLCIKDVFDVASGDLSLPGKIR